MVILKLIYYVKEAEDKIRIMSNNFVKKYSSKLKIIYKNKLSEPREFISISNQTKKVKIYFIFYKKINFEDIIEGCESLYKIYNIGYDFEFIGYQVIKLYYIIKSSDTKIKIFGENFVKNNKDKCFIICENIIYPLKSYFLVDDVEKKNFGSKKLEISLIITKNIPDKSYMFYNCSMLEKIETSDKKHAKVETLNKIDSEDDLVEDFDAKKNEFEFVDFVEDDKSNFIYEDIYEDIDIYPYFSISNEIAVQTRIKENSTFQKINPYFEFGNLEISFMKAMKAFYPLSDLDFLISSNLSHIFDGCISLISISDISQWNTCNVIDMSYMFNYCFSLESLSDISNWSTKNVKDISYLFCRCSSLKSISDISKWNTNNIIKMNNIFSGCISLFELPDISKWNTNKTTNLSYLFFQCSSLISIPDISKWNTQNVIDMSFMFSYCASLISLPDISKWNTYNVINFSFMFSHCSLLDNFPDISKWKYYNVMDMSFMFYGCLCLKNLPIIDMGDTYKTKNICYMFNECPSLISTPKIDKYNSSNITDMSIKFNDCKSIKLFYKNKESDNKMKIFGKIFVFNNRGNFMILFNNKLLPLQEYLPTQLIEEKHKSIEISLINLEDIYYKEYMKYLCYKKEELELKKG